MIVKSKFVIEVKNILYTQVQRYLLATIFFKNQNTSFIARKLLERIIRTPGKRKHRELLIQFPYPCHIV